MSMLKFRHILDSINRSSLSVSSFMCQTCHLVTKNALGVLTHTKGVLILVFIFPSNISFNDLFGNSGQSTNLSDRGAFFVELLDAGIAIPAIQQLKLRNVLTLCYL